MNSVAVEYLLTDFQARVRKKLGWELLFDCEANGLYSARNTRQGIAVPSPFPDTNSGSFNGGAPPRCCSQIRWQARSWCSRNWVYAHDFSDASGAYARHRTQYPRCYCVLPMAIALPIEGAETLTLHLAGFRQSSDHLSSRRWEVGRKCTMEGERLREVLAATYPRT